MSTSPTGKNTKIVRSDFMTRVRIPVPSLVLYVWVYIDFAISSIYKNKNKKALYTVKKYINNKVIELNWLMSFLKDQSFGRTGVELW